MDLKKHNSILDPLIDIHHPIHIIGCGAIGSNLAVMLTRLGIINITLWDFDLVEPHNLTNQAFFARHLHLPKTSALKSILKEINPDVKITEKAKYTKQPLAGYVFLCVDSIEVRQNVVKQNMYTSYILAMFDFRMGLYTAQHYATIWEPAGIAAFLKTMDFTDEEARINVPVSPCGTTLSVMPTVQTIVGAGIINFIKFLKTPEQYKRVIIVDLYEVGLIAL